MILALSTNARLILPPNRLRKSLLLINEDTAITIFVKFEKQDGLSVSSTDHDVRLLPSDNFAISVQEDGEEQVKGRITAIAASGTPNLAVFETEDIRR